MVDEKELSSEEIKNAGTTSTAPDDNLQATADENVPTTKRKSKAVASVSDGITETDEAQLDNDAQEADPASDDDELDDAEYEKIKQDLLNEYLSEQNETGADQDNQSAAEQTEEPNSQDASQDAEESSIEDTTQAEFNQNSQEAINSIMGNETNATTDEVYEIEDVEANLEGNKIDDDFKASNNTDSLTPDVDQGISKVAISKGSSVIIMVMVVLVLIYIIYKMLQPDHSTDVNTDTEINPNMPIVKPVQDVGQTIIVPEIPKFPETPKQLPAPTPQAMPTPPLPPLLDVTPVAPPPPPTIATAPAGLTSAPAGLTPPPISLGTSGNVVSPATLQDLGDLDEEAAQKKAQDDARKQSRLKSSIMVAGGGKGKNPNANPAGQDLTKLARNHDQIAATYIGDLHRIIAQGKVIDAILETAINTDLPGQIRAIVARDVYSEAGKNILINRGSRLIGSYSADIKYGQARVQIMWERIIRPDGIDIKVASSGVDDIGRAGMGGEVDNHILSNFAAAIMMSAINISLADLADKNGGSSGGTTTSTSSTDATSGTTTSSATANTLNNEQQAYQDALNTLSKMTNDIIGKSLNMPPTITVDQGTPLKVFVKKDIVFPGPSANLTRMID